MEGRHRAWAAAFGIGFLLVAAYFLRASGHRSAEHDAPIVLTLGLVLLLVGLRFLFAAFSGRFPRWMVTFIDIR